MLTASPVTAAIIRAAISSPLSCGFFLIMSLYRAAMYSLPSLLAVLRLIIRRQSQT